MESSDEEEDLEVVPPPSPSRLCHCRIREVWITVAGETLAPDQLGVSFGSSSGSPQPVPPCMQVPEVIRVSSSDEDEEVEIVPPIRAMVTFAAEAGPSVEHPASSASVIRVSSSDEDEEVEIVPPVGALVNFAAEAGPSDEPPASSTSIIDPSPIEHSISSTVPPSSPSHSIQCQVCMEFSNSIRMNGYHLLSTVCGHIFCSCCLPECIRNSPTCPTCRRRLSSKDYHRIYIN